jgi:hypothetical protein
VLRLFPCTGPTPRLILSPSHQNHQEREKEGGLDDAPNEEPPLPSPHSHCFSLLLNSRTEREEEWRLCAASQEDLDAWVHALSPYVIISGGNGGGKQQQQQQSNRGE